MYNEKNGGSEIISIPLDSRIVEQIEYRTNMRFSRGINHYSPFEYIRSPGIEQPSKNIQRPRYRGDVLWKPIEDISITEKELKTIDDLLDTIPKQKTMESRLTDKGDVECIVPIAKKIDILSRSKASKLLPGNHLEIGISLISKGEDELKFRDMPCYRQVHPSDSKDLISSSSDKELASLKPLDLSSSMKGPLNVKSKHRAILSRLNKTTQNN